MAPTSRIRRMTADIGIQIILILNKVVKHHAGDGVEDATMLNIF